MQRNGFGSRLIVQRFYLDRYSIIPTVCSAIPAKTVSQKYHFRLLWRIGGNIPPQIPQLPPSNANNKSVRSGVL